MNDGMYMKGLLSGGSSLCQVQFLAGAVASCSQQTCLAPPPSARPWRPRLEELSSPWGMVGRGGMYQGLLLAPFWAAMAVLADTHGGVRCSAVSSSSPQEVSFGAQSYDPRVLGRAGQGLGL